METPASERAWRLGFWVLMLTYLLLPGWIRAAAVTTASGVSPNSL